VKPFDMIREKEWKPKVVIYLTDLDGTIPDITRDPGVPTLWVCINERHHQEELPFGELCVFTQLNKSGW
jgi:predicted metal-dependent peptidase